MSHLTLGLSARSTPPSFIEHGREGGERLGHGRTPHWLVCPPHRAPKPTWWEAGAFLTVRFGCGPAGRNGCGSVSADGQQWSRKKRVLFLVLVHREVALALTVAKMEGGQLPCRGGGRGHGPG